MIRNGVHNLVPAALAWPVLALLASGLFLAGCKDPATGKSAVPPARTLEFRDFALTRYPRLAPRSLPSLFRYPGARLLRSGVYRSSRIISPPEGVVVMTTKDEPAIVALTYRKLLKASGWSIIQTRNTPNERLIMTESPSPRSRSLITVIIRRGSTTQIKIYFKRSET